MSQDNPVAGALTADCVRNYELGNVVEYGLDANVVIYQGAPVIVDGVVAGLANNVETAAGAGTFAGFAIKRSDNRVGAIAFVGDAPGSGLAGARRVRANNRGKVVLWVAGSPTTVGALVYATTSDSFTSVKPGSGAAYIVGRIAEFTTDAITNSLTRCVVEYDAFTSDALSGETRAFTTTLYPANGAIAPNEGSAVITKSSAIAVMTLALPIAGTDDGKRLEIRSATARAHTVTTPALGYNGATHIATFGGAIGDGMELLAYNGTWLVMSNTNVTLS